MFGSIARPHCRVDGVAGHTGKWRPMEMQDAADKRAKLICTMLQRFPAVASTRFAAKIVALMARFAWISSSRGCVRTHCLQQTICAVFRCDHRKACITAGAVCASAVMQRITGSMTR